MYGVLLKQMADRLRWSGRAKTSLFFLPLTSDRTLSQGREEDEEEEILAAVLSSSPRSSSWQRWRTDDEGLRPSDHPWVGVF